MGGYLIFAAPLTNSRIAHLLSFGRLQRASAQSC